MPASLGNVQIRGNHVLFPRIRNTSIGKTCSKVTRALVGRSAAIYRQNISIEGNTIVNAPAAAINVVARHRRKSSHPWQSVPASGHRT